MSRLNAEAAEQQKSAEHRIQVDEVDDEESDVEFELDGEPENDDTEDELERLVFGDSAGFREGLKDVESGEEVGDERDAETTGLEGFDDADVGLAGSFA